MEIERRKTDFQTSYFLFANNLYRTNIETTIK